MSEFAVRAATPADADAIASVWVESWRAAYKDILPRTFLDGMCAGVRAPLIRISMRDEPYKEWSLLLRGDEEVVGYSQIGPGSGWRVGEIGELYLVPAVWGLGAGRLLFEHASARLVERRFRAGSLWVLAANDRARRFYERAGWTVDGTTADFPVAGEKFPAVRYALRWG